MTAALSSAVLIPAWPSALRRATTTGRQACPSPRAMPAQVVCCQAGCDTRDVLAALGLAWTDLFDRPRQRQARAPRRPITEYRYTDEAGELVFVKVRYEPKDFLVKRPDGSGGWVAKLGDAPRVLYRLPEVTAAVSEGRTVYVVEGEKDADRLASARHCATCNFDGAAKDGQRAQWKAEHNH